MDLDLVLRAVFALIAVLGLIGLAAFAARRAPMLRAGMTGKAAPRARRLAVSERLVLDARRQVVILRDGAREHVVLLGATSEKILESRMADASGDGPNLRLVDPQS